MVLDCEKVKQYLLAMERRQVWFLWKHYRR